MEAKVYQTLADITAIATAHQQGSKFVFLKNEDSPSALTQFAYGKFMPGESSKMHVHQTMEECFFIAKGTGNCIIGGENYALSPGTFLRIPAGIYHQLDAGANDVLEFVYFGVAV